MRGFEAPCRCRCLVSRSGGGHFSCQELRARDRAKMASSPVVSFGYMLSSEEHAPAELGAIAAITDRLQVRVGVTCPTIRIHPAILAQATAATSLLFGDRFLFGVGTGEALNEHILGHRWPPADVCLAMLEEAVGIIRELWTGETVDHRGDFFDVENAKLFDPPTKPTAGDRVGLRTERGGPRRADRRRLLGALLPGTRPPRPLPPERRGWASVRTAEAVLGRGRRRGAQDSAHRVAERRHERPAQPRPCRPGRTSRTPPPWSTRTTPANRFLVDPTSAQSSSRSPSSSTPATTTSTSIRSAPTRTASSSPGPTSCSRLWLSFASRSPDTEH